MRREKKLTKTDSERNTDKKPDKKSPDIFSKFLLAGGLMAALSFSPKAKAEEWKECSCDEINKKVECGNTVYSGYKIVYDKKNKKLTCYCVSCPDLTEEPEEKEKKYETDFEDYYYGDDCYYYDEKEDLCYSYEEYCVEDGIDTCAEDYEDSNCYWDEACGDDYTEHFAISPPEKKPAIKITLDSNRKGFAEKWLELELNALGRIDKDKLVKLGYPTDDISEIKKQSMEKLSEIVSNVVKELEANGLGNPKTKEDAALFFTIVGKVLYEDMGIEYAEGDDEGTLLSKSLVDNRLDCDLSSAIIVEIADLLGLPIKFVEEESDTVGHVFVAWEFDDGEHLYFESTSMGSVMTSDDFYEEQESVEDEVLSECEDYDEDDYCDEWDDATLNMYKTHPDEKPEIILDAFERMDLIGTILNEFKSDIDEQLYDLLFYFDDPEYYRGFVVSGCEYYKNPEKEIKDLEKMIKLVGSWDESAGLYLLLGYAYSKEKDHENSKKNYEIALGKYENLLAIETSPRLYVEYAETLKGLGRVSNAHEYFKKADDLCETKYNAGLDDPGIYYWWGIALEALGEKDEAISTYNLGIQLCNERIKANENSFSVRDAYEVMYGIEVQKGNYKKAKKLLKKF